MNNRSEAGQSVLLLTNSFSPNVGGAETHLDDFVRALTARGWRVNVLSFYPLTTPVPWKRYEDRGALKIWRMGWFGRNWFHVLEHYPVLQFLYLVPRSLAGAFVWLLLRGRRVSVIHAHGLVPAFNARLLAPLFRKRYVFSSHSVYGLSRQPAVRRAARWMLGRADRVLALSRESADEIVAAGVDARRVATFRYWVDLACFSPGDQAAARRERGLPANGVIALFVGRLLEIKGVRRLLAVAQRAELRSMTFVFAGVGPLADEVAAAAAADARIVFAGRVSNTDLPAYYRAADVLCVPSLYAEGYGRVILESLACGTPVLGADCPGIREATSDRVAWLVEPSEEALTAVLAAIQRDPRLARDRAAACREFAEERYSEKNADSIAAALSDDQ